jgi:uncharacterized RmlC-like cupin family protein
VSDVPGCFVVRRGVTHAGAQGLVYAAGLTGRSAGTRGFCLTESTLPPGACSRAHLHRGIESGGYVIEGTVESLWGDRLEHSALTHTGDFVYIPADLPHAVRNPTDELARILVAHTASDDQEGIVLLPELDPIARQPVGLDPAGRHRKEST